MPLIRGRYPLSNPVQALFGQMANVVNASRPCRSNVEYFGIGNPSDGALAATGVGCAVPIPWEPGDVVSKIRIMIGATAESGGSHAFAAVYSGIATPALIGQTTDQTGAAAAGASAVFDMTMATAAQITPAQCPNGFIYVSISFTATVPTAASMAIPTAVGYQWTTNGPLFLSATHGSSLGGTAAATIASPAAKAVAPIVIVT